VQDVELDVDMSILPIVQVEIERLMPGFSLRLAGTSEANIELLCAADREPPPILVHRHSNRVIDGTHRLMAARRRGLETILARYYDGSEADAFVLAVRANVTKGLALPLRDRKVAAARILGSHGQWSNRRIAATCGLSDKTVAAIRAQIDQPTESAPERIGVDGRARPVDRSGRRALVARLIGEDPSASLRQIAVRAGVSPETVRSVRAGVRSTNADPAPAAVPQPAASDPDPDPRQRLARLAKDPALRSTEAGRLLLRLLSAYPVLERETVELVGAAPQHTLASLSSLAAAHAEAWHALADQVAWRMRQLNVPKVNVPTGHIAVT
jgi:ParB-like chromosome segregation protein Spo0J